MTFPPEMTEQEAALIQARRMLQFITAARDYFPAMRDLADHPGWEIVLHIYIAGKEGQTLSTLDLCERTGTWRPLAVRYVEMLFERGLVDRDISSGKPESWSLSLTADAEARLLELLTSFARNNLKGG